MTTKLPSQMNYEELVKVKEFLKVKLKWAKSQELYPIENIEETLRWLELIEDELVLRGHINYEDREY